MARLLSSYFFKAMIHAPRESVNRYDWPRCKSSNHFQCSLLRYAKQFFLLAVFNMNASSEPPHHCTRFIVQWCATDKKPMEDAVRAPQSDLAFAPLLNVARSPRV